MENIVNPIPENPVIATKPKTNYLNLVLISFAFVLFIVGVYYFYRQLTVKSEIITTPTADQTSSIKTYTNKYLKYQIDIPKDWNIEEYGTQVSLSSPDKNIYIYEGNQAVFSSWKQGLLSAETLPLPDIMVGDINFHQTYQSTFNSENDFNIKANEWSKEISLFTDYVAVNKNFYLPSFHITIKGDLEKSESQIISILKSFKNVGTLPSIDDLVTYSIPSGWNVIKQESIDYINFSSPDFVVGEAFSGQIGMIFSVSSTFNLPKYSLEEAAKDSTDNSDFTNIFVDNLPAIKYHMDFEGHQLIYNVIKGDRLFWISFMSNNITEENKYQKQIDEFISSIKFKEYDGY